MKNKRLYIAGFIVAVAVLVSAYVLGIFGAPNDTFGVRYTQNELVIFDGLGTMASISSYDGGDDTIITEANHGLVIGDVVMFNTASAGFGGETVAGFSEATKYYVITASSSTIFEISTTKGGTALDIGAAASAGGGEWITEEFVEKDFNVEGYNDILCSYNTEEGASLSIFFEGSIEDSAPDWHAPKSTTNRYEHIGVIITESDTEVEGDAGVRVDDTDTNEMYLIYPTKGLKWMTVISENFASGSVDVRCKGIE